MSNINQSINTKKMYHFEFRVVLLILNPENEQQMRTPQKKWTVERQWPR
jgi:hypothetical protein